MFQFGLGETTLSPLEPFEPLKADPLADEDLAFEDSGVVVVEDQGVLGVDDEAAST